MTVQLEKTMRDSSGWDVFKEVAWVATTGVVATGTAGE